MKQNVRNVLGKHKKSAARRLTSGKWLISSIVIFISFVCVLCFFHLVFWSAGTDSTHRAYGRTHEDGSYRRVCYDGGELVVAPNYYTMNDTGDWFRNFSDAHPLTLTASVPRQCSLNGKSSLGNKRVLPRLILPECAAVIFEEYFIKHYDEFMEVREKSNDSSLNSIEGVFLLHYSKYENRVSKRRKELARRGIHHFHLMTMFDKEDFEYNETILNCFFQGPDPRANRFLTSEIHHIESDKFNPLIRETDGFFGLAKDADGENPILNKGEEWNQNYFDFFGRWRKFMRENVKEALPLKSLCLKAHFSLYVAYRLNYTTVLVLEDDFLLRAGFVAALNDLFATDGEGELPLYFSFISLGGCHNDHGYRLTNTYQSRRPFPSNGRRSEEAGFWSRLLQRHTARWRYSTHLFYARRMNCGQATVYSRQGIIEMLTALPILYEYDFTASVAVDMYHRELFLSPGARLMEAQKKMQMKDDNVEMREKVKMYWYEPWLVVQEPDDVCLDTLVEKRACSGKGREHLDPNFDPANDLNPRYNLSWRAVPWFRL